jgi:hypothetical protein
MKFMVKQNNPLFLKGVVYGDSGTGKTTFAFDFLQNSCKIRKINKAILVDTEDGWSWLKKHNQINDIEILEPETKLTKNNCLETFESISNLLKTQQIACIIIDSISHIGELLADLTLENAKQKNAKYGKVLDDLRYTDWAEIRENQNKIISILKNLNCDILLVGRATSEYESTIDQKGKNVITNARSREVKGWKQITFEFDFTILAEMTIDITKEKEIKDFSFITLKSRILDDGNKIKNINHWYDLIDINHNKEIINFEIIKQKLLSSNNINELKQNWILIQEHKIDFTADENKELENIKNTMKNEIEKI